MAQANMMENNYDVEAPQSTEAEGVVHIKKFQQTEEIAEKEVLELSAFEQVMMQMNIADRDDFDSQYIEMWNRASETQEMLSVIVCEIDFFQEYSENYGQQASSFMLLVIALALKTTCEEHDCYFARYKGNEFGILVKALDATAATNIAEELRAAVENSRTEHKFSSVADVVTLSIGLSSVYPTSMQAEMNHTSSALYTAKISGYNQVSSYFNASNDRFSAKPEIQNVIIETEAPSQQDVEFTRMMQEMSINNKSDFQNYFDNVWQESIIDDDLLSMLDLELDFFNEYTEHYSKQYANETILVVAIALKAKCDEIGCFFAHIDNGRFSVIIQGGNATKGLKVSESMKSTLQELQLEHLASPVKEISTMSIGLSNIFPSDLNTMKILSSKVNNALEIAKSNGYDQIGVEI